MKKTLGIIFLTVFIDLMGFSVIFPLFPALIEFYTVHDADNFLLQAILGFAAQFDPAHTIVIFGGILGSLYSLLQFIATPIWGGISDRIGRRPVLLISLVGLFISYLLWIFAESFTVLIMARLIGGLMAGNISIASAAIADITTQEERSKGMAIIGVAFALGFILGPFFGGVSTVIELGGIASYTPFSLAAIFASVLTLLNLFLVWRYFKETLPPEKRGTAQTERTANLFKLFRPLSNKSINLTNWSYFTFLLVFAGMEFTLTFLAAERLSYTPMDNGKLFVFIGVIIALTQGGIVRRYAHKVGERKMVLVGMTFTIPSFILLSLAHSSSQLYFALFFMAVGSAMIIPCLTALVSLFTTAEQQGQSLGVFRSMGALARALGPLSAAFLYWLLGPTLNYQIGAMLIGIPIILVYLLPKKILRHY